jgi:tetratricopeptide (TPR) repeat protein
MPFLQRFKPRVFVAMPFGKREVEPATAERPAVEVNFDDVYTTLLKPALEAAGCTAFRADEEEGAGDIRTDMFFELATADFVLADISNTNPNVFYELGIRQGMAERGVIMVYDRQTKRPFDIAPDRTFAYKGTLFRPPAPADLAAQLEKEVATLATKIAGAIAADPQGQSSPLYKEMTGLRPPDVRAIKGGRARYFDAVVEGIANRVLVAKKQGRAGDILTLAEEAPNAIYRSKLLYQAARSLIDLRRFDLAEELLREVITLDPANADARSFLGLVLNRIGRPAEAEVYVQQLVESAQGHADANGALARVYKDQWRLKWEGVATVEDRRKRAHGNREIAQRALRRYAGIFLKDARSYYNGINVVALGKLLAHLGTSAEEIIPPPDELVPLIKVVARHAQEVNQTPGNESARDEYVWATATLAELHLLAGREAEATEAYRQASTTPGVSPFAIESMLDQVKMYEALAFEPATVAAVTATLKSALAPQAGQGETSGKVIFCSGHMIDADDRKTPRFPRDREKAVAAWIRQELERWNTGPNDIGICGGARGTDLLFAEACLERKTPVELYLPLEEGRFLKSSVHLPRSDWGARYFAVRDNPLTTYRFQPAELGEPAAKADPYGRNNRWMLNTAWVRAQDRNKLRVLLVWDGKSTGDGPGGTSHAAEIARELAGDWQTVDPLTLAALAAKG